MVAPITTSAPITSLATELQHSRPSSPLEAMWYFSLVRSREVNKPVGPTRADNNLRANESVIESRYFSEEHFQGLFTRRGCTVPIDTAVGEGRFAGTIVERRER